MFIFVHLMFFDCIYDNQGLIPAMEMFPTVEHRFCVKHIYNNFKLNFKGLELRLHYGDVLQQQQLESLRRECKI